MHFSNVSSSASPYIHSPRASEVSLSDEQQKVAVSQFFTQVMNGEEISDKEWGSPLGDSRLTERLLPGSYLGCCLCRIYPLETRIEIAKEFVANVIKNEPHSPEGGIIEIIKSRGSLSYFSFGSGLLLQELLQIRLLLEETKKGKALELLKNLKISVQDGFYDTPEKKYAIPYEKALAIFREILIDLGEEFNIQIEFNCLSSRDEIPKDTLVVSCIDVVDDIGEEKNATLCLDTLRRYAVRAPVNARIFVSYRLTNTPLEISLVPYRTQRVFSNFLLVYGGMYPHAKEMHQFIRCMK